MNDTEDHEHDIMGLYDDNDIVIPTVTDGGDDHHPSPDDNGDAIIQALQSNNNESSECQEESIDNILHADDVSNVNYYEEENENTVINCTTTNNSQPKSPEQQSVLSLTSSPSKTMNNSSQSNGSNQVKVAPVIKNEKVPETSNSPISNINDAVKSTIPTTATTAISTNKITTYSTPIAQSQPTSSSTSKQQYNEIEALNDEIATLLLTNKITITTSSKLQSILRENISLKEKNNKLKSLLSRSSKASKETKVELDKAQKEIHRLTQRLEVLANRPTHLDLLADFETNFDRALMSLHSEGIEKGGVTSTVVGGENHHSLFQQSGEDTRDPTGGEQENVSTLLLTELSQTKARMEQLESLNTQLAQRATFLGKENKQFVSQLERQNLKMSNLQLELRMSKMETENAIREMKAKAASLAEMQMEIDLVTRSAMDANARAAEGAEFAKSMKSDKEQIDELKAKVAALQEWAVASAEAKEVILEENKLLEQRLRHLENADCQKKGDGKDELLVTTTLRSDNISPSSKGKISERKLWTKSASLVIGAGMSECRVIELGENLVMDFEVIILKWKFDLTLSDLDIVFSILKGRFDNRDKNAMKNAHSLVRERRVVGGGGGEVEGAFVIQNACTFVFSNEHSWVRPRTIKYEVEAFAIR